MPANIDRLRKQHHSSLPTLTKQNRKHLVIALINKQRRDNHSPNATSLTTRRRERILLSPNPSFLTNLQAKNKQQEKERESRGGKEKEQEQQKDTAGRRGRSSRRAQQVGNGGGSGSSKGESRSSGGRRDNSRGRARGGSRRRARGRRERRQNKTRLLPAHIARWRKSKPCAILIPT